MYDYYKHVAEKVDVEIKSCGDAITVSFFDGEDTHDFVIKGQQAKWLHHALKRAYKFKKDLLSD